MVGKKYYFSKPFKTFSRSEINTLLEQEIFNSNHFMEHIKEVSYRTKISEEIVSDVLRSYITNIFIVMNQIRKIKTKINVYGFFSLIVEKGSRI